MRNCVAKQNKTKPTEKKRRFSQKKKIELMVVGEEEK